MKITWARQRGEEMRFLFITDNPIHGYGGGSIENQKQFHSIYTYCRKYDHELKVMSLDTDIKENRDYHVTKNRFSDILSRIQGHSSYMFRVWKKNRKKVFEYNPDVIILERSRLGFIAKDVKQNNNCKVVTNIENVEMDYIDGYFAEKNNFFYLIIKYFEKKIVFKDERDSIMFSDKLVYLTLRDVNRIRELYNYIDNNPCIVPICLPKLVELKKESNKKTIAFVGSLNYSSNIQAVKTIVKDIWEKTFSCNDNLELIIAGREPSNELKSLLNKYKNVTLISNFEDLSLILPKSSLLLAPIKEGAGMKVKVADAMSMGLIIIGSDEALVGYEEAVTKSEGIKRANTPEEYIEFIKEYISMPVEKINEVSEVNKRIFDDKYSYKTSVKLLEKFYNEL